MRLLPGIRENNLYLNSTTKRVFHGKIKWVFIWNGYRFSDRPQEKEKSMFFTDYLVDNYEMIYELAGLVIMLVISVHVSDRMKSLTRWTALLLFVESLVFALERWTQSYSQLSLLRPLLTAGLYSLYPAILLLVMQTIIPKNPSRRTIMLLSIPWLLSIPVFFSSQWTRLVCWYTSDNHYQAGPLYRLPYFLFAFYCLVFLVLNMRYFRRYSRLNRSVTDFISFGAMAGVLLYLFCSDGKDYSGLFTAAILLYYICIYIHMAMSDPLTGLLNRQSYYQTTRINSKQITAVASVDMNELKYYNDTFGHEAGDAALVTIAEALQKGCGKGATVYRVGGDEFVVIYLGIDEAGVQASIENMRRQLADTEYICAFGYDMKDPDETLDDVVSKADAQMYKDKTELKAKLVANGGVLHNRH